MRRTERVHIRTRERDRLSLAESSFHDEDMEVHLGAGWMKYLLIL